MKTRPLAKGDAAAATALLETSFDAGTIQQALAEIDGAVAAEEQGVLFGVGFVRWRGDVATVGPIASLAPGRKIGGAVLDALIAEADERGCASVRAFVGAGLTDAFALFAGRAFAAVDVVACLTRPIAAAPKLDSTRGLEIGAFKPADLDELAALDLKLTGLDRKNDLKAHVRLVARRRGAVAGFIGATGSVLGPAIALDVPDLAALIARALAEGASKEETTCRLSMAAPTAVLAALGLGFRVSSVGHVLSRGLAPPTRPPQLYSVAPEIC